MLRDILVVHHTHTDWGYTTHPSQIGEQHCRHLDEAIRLCRLHRDNGPTRQYRWTCESALVVDMFLKTRNEAAQRQLRELIEVGLIELTAAPLCPTPLSDASIIRAGLETTIRLRERLGFNIPTAMFCDINGLNWPWCDELRSIGVENIAMAMNFFAGGGMPRYRAFHWKCAQRDDCMRVWHGQHYNMGAFWGLNHHDFKMEEVVPQRLRELEEHQYPYEKLLLQVTSIPADNMGPHPKYLDFIDDYNRLAERHDWPAMRTATLADWFAYLKVAEPSPPIETGDWTDWWASVLPNSPRSVAISMETARRIDLVERWMLRAGGREIDTTAFRRFLHEVRCRSFVVNEHIFGSSSSAAAPYRHAALACDAFQLNLAYEALYSVTSLLKDLVRAAEGGEVAVLDPQLESHDPTWAQVASLGQESRGIDVDIWYDEKSSSLKSASQPDPAMRIELLPESNGRGWGLSWSQTGRHITSAQNGGALGSIVVERPATGTRAEWFSKDFGPHIQWSTDSWPRQSKWTRSVLSPIDAPCISTTPQGVTNAEVLLETLSLEPDLRVSSSVIASLATDVPAVDFTFKIRVGETTEPFSIYVPFPIALQPDRVLVDVGGTWIEPVKDQLPGACLNWLTAHQGVYVEDHTNGHSLLWTSWDAPVLMLENICPSPPKARQPLRSAHVFSWAIGNYWITNVTSRVSGEYVFRYQLRVWDGPQTMEQLNRWVGSRTPPSSLRAVRRCTGQE